MSKRRRSDDSQLVSSITQSDPAAIVAAARSDPAQLQALVKFADELKMQSSSALAAIAAALAAAKRQTEVQCRERLDAVGACIACEGSVEDCGAMLTCKCHGTADAAPTGLRLCEGCLEEGQGLDANDAKQCSECDALLCGYNDDCHWQECSECSATVCKETCADSMETCSCGDALCVGCLSDKAKIYCNNCSGCDSALCISCDAEQCTNCNKWACKRGCMQETRCGNQKFCSSCIESVDADE